MFFLRIPLSAVVILAMLHTNVSKKRRRLFARQPLLKRPKSAR